LGGALADRIGARRTLAGGLVLTGAGAVSIALLHAAWQALAATALFGLGAAVVWPSQDALLAGLAGEQRRSAAFSVRYATMNVGLGVGSLAGAVWAGALGGGLVVLFWVQAVALLAYALVVSGLPEPAPEATVASAEDGAGGYRAVLGDRALRRLLVLIAVLFAAGYAQCNAAVPVYATGDGGLAPGALGVVFAANTITVVVAQLLVFRFVADWRRSRGLALAATTWALAWLIMLIGGQLGGGPASMIAFAVGMAAFGVGETLLSPMLMPLVNDLAPDALRGRYNGAAALACTTGFMLGPLVAGAALGAGLGGAFIGALTATCLLAALGAMTLERRLPGPANGRPRPTTAPIAEVLAA
jgi:MFS family permease